MYLACRLFTCRGPSQRPSASSRRAAGFWNPPTLRGPIKRQRDSSIASLSPNSCGRGRTSRNRATTMSSRAKKKCSHE